MHIYFIQDLIWDAYIFSAWKSSGTKTLQKVWRVLYSLIVWLLYTGNFSVAVSPLSWSGPGSKWRSGTLPKRSNLNISILTCFHCFDIQWSFPIFYLPGVGTEDGTVAMKPLAEGLAAMFYTIWWKCTIFLERIFLPILHRFKTVHLFFIKLSISRIQVHSLKTFSCMSVNCKLHCTLYKIFVAVIIL